MPEITKSIHVDMAHSIRGHRGACIAIHGHTWRFEVSLGCMLTDRQGFVRDFSDLKQRVLQPVHDLLDHGFAIGVDTWLEIQEPLRLVGERLIESRIKVHGSEVGMPQRGIGMELLKARGESCGGIKVIVFPFSPTSERLAEWLFEFASQQYLDEMGNMLLQDTAGTPWVGSQEPLKVIRARVYETLHPVESYATYGRSWE